MTTETNKLTKEQLATFLDGNQYGSEVDRALEESAKASGLVILTGYSDDNAEFYGAIREEVGCGERTVFLLTPERVFREGDHDCECEFCGYREVVKKAKRIRAIWDRDGYSWQYATEIPHATFDIWEDGQKYCRGIVFSVEDMKA